MFLFKSLTFYFISVVIVAVNCQSETTVTEPNSEVSSNRTNLTDTSLKENTRKKVNVKVYYETLCPYCRDFGRILKTEVMTWPKDIDLQLYPYGNAETTNNNGTYTFDCQHGEEECYGNKLHACAIDILGNITQAVMYTSCMMDPSREDEGSNDAAADECAVLHSLNSEPVKNCAKSSKGSELLKFYGDETAKASIRGVPRILINGYLTDSRRFSTDLLEEIVFM